MVAPLPGLCSTETQCDWPPLALGSAGGRRPAQPPPRPLPGRESLTEGAKYRQADLFIAMKYGRKPRWSACLPICVHVRLTGGQRSLCHHRLGGIPALGEQQRQCLFIRSPLSSSSSSFISAQVACRSQAGSHVVCICVEPRA